MERESERGKKEGKKEGNKDAQCEYGVCAIGQLPKWGKSTTIGITCLSGTEH